MIGGMSTWVFIRFLFLSLGARRARHAVAARRAVRARASGPPLRSWSSASPGAGCATPQEFVPLVSSMAFLILFENLAVAYWGSDLQSVPPLFGSADWRIGGLVISMPQLFGLALLDRPDLGPVAAAGPDAPRPRAADHRRGFQHRASARRRYQPHRASGVRHQRAVRGARRRAVRPQLPAGASVHGRGARPQGHLRHGGRRHGQYLGRHRRRAHHRHGRGACRSATSAPTLSISRSTACCCSS